MSNQMFHPTDALGAYALGACTDDEAATVAAHVKSCTACAAELRTLEISTQALLADVPEATPSPDVKARLMHRVRADAELFAAAQQPRQTEEPARPAWRERLRGLARPVPALAVMASCALAVTLVISTTDRNDAGPAVVVAKVDTNRAPGANARVVISEDGAQLRVDRMPDPGNGRTYQVWVRSGEEPPRPAGVLFDVDDRGRATAELPADLDGVDQMLVTSEPAGGSAQPTRQPVLSATI